MRRPLALVSVWVCTAGLTAAWAQHGHGMGGGGGHGAPPSFAPSAMSTSPKATGGQSAAARTSMPSTTSVSTKVANNPAIVERVQPLLPAGVTLSSAAAGFRNQGQFLAALHVSRNLGIPFSQLKAEMTSTRHDS